MELKNWKLQYPLSFDINRYHSALGALSDFFTDGESGESYRLLGECCVVGNIYDCPNIKDGTLVTTAPAWKIKRLAKDDPRGYDYVVTTETENVYFVRYDTIDPQFRDAAWTFGTPHATPK